MKKFQEFGDKCWNVTSSMSGIIMFLVSIMIIINVILRRFTSVSIVGCNELVPQLEDLMFEKSTVLPCESVIFPSSST